MKRILFLLFFCQLGLSHAQESSFKYVRVPAKFEFLNEEDKFQLNALTAFLFEKEGFEVLYKEPVPAGVDVCEVLTADVENNSNFFRTKLQVTLRDCAEKIVFTSEEGVSNQKEYTKSYQDALRKAFESVGKFASEMPKMSAINATAAVSQSALPEENVSGAEKEVAVSSAKPGASTFFTNGRQDYELRQDASGYVLFKSGEEEKFATLLESGSGSNYIYTSKNLQGNAFFDAEGNLIVEYLDPNIDQLVSVKYQLKD